MDANCQELLSFVLVQQVQLSLYLTSSMNLLTFQSSGCTDRNLSGVIQNILICILKIN